MDLNQIVDELYGLPPNQFTARRDDHYAAAKKAGDPELAVAVKALRRPTAAAFAINLTARTRSDRIDALIELGGRMKAAQDARSGDELRALGRVRSQLIHTMTQEVRSLAREAGHPVSDAAAREIESTLEAAFADTWAGEAVRQGRLVRALERSGLAPADLEGAVAGSLPTPGGRATPRRTKPVPLSDAEGAGAAAVAAGAAEAERAEAERAAGAAEARVAETATQLATAVAEHDAAIQQRDQAEGEVRRLEEGLRAARDRADRAVDAETAARRARHDAERTNEEATRAAERARDAADLLKS